MQLAAWERGIGPCIYTTQAREVYDLLGVPGDYALSVVAGLGYPPGEVEGRKRRKPLEEIAHSGRFGEPLHVR